MPEPPDRGQVVGIRVGVVDGQQALHDRRNRGEERDVMVGDQPQEFVRVEPFLVAKEDITNEINEKVDTQIFQIIYKIKKKDPHIFAGARMDVFIEREPAS